MSYDINTCTLIGRLTRDIELRKTQSGLAVGKISIANNTTGDKEKVSFFDCYLFGDFAENMAQYLTKGKAVAITGRLVQDRWTNNEGQARSRIKIIIDKLSLLSSSGEKEYNSNSSKDYSQNYKQNTKASPPQPDEPDNYNDIDIDEDDNIPF